MHSFKLVLAGLLLTAAVHSNAAAIYPIERAVFFADHPDYYDTFQAHVEGVNAPTVKTGGAR